MSHHEETQLNTNRGPNPNPKGEKSAIAPNHGCSNHLNLEMEAECLTKTLNI